MALRILAICAALGGLAACADPGASDADMMRAPGERLAALMVARGCRYGTWDLVEFQLATGWTADENEAEMAALREGGHLRLEDGEEQGMLVLTDWPGCP